MNDSDERFRKDKDEYMRKNYPTYSPVFLIIGTGVLAELGIGAAAYFYGGWNLVGYAILGTAIGVMVGLLSANMSGR